MPSRNPKPTKAGATVRKAGVSAKTEATALKKAPVKPPRKMKERVKNVRKAPATDTHTVLIKDVPPAITDAVLLAAVPGCTSVHWWQTNFGGDLKVGHLNFATLQAASAVGGAGQVVVDGHTLPVITRTSGTTDGCIFCLQHGHKTRLCPARDELMVRVNKGPTLTDKEVSTCCGPVQEIRRKNSRGKSGPVEFLIFPTKAKAQAVLQKKTITLKGKAYKVKPVPAHPQ
eukprot:NODE_4447_length_786_cov_34.159332_g4288_i0.p1 GENE.NODE_4447_length_786_cov_34.159332_g4288_i0~~NODE_4447_length_786_cov_34.159332_g4288_i0.p1  ORF type:complete len:229 (+),score=53.27 NODE_4447_length_786_cov_34.159332_g4288_i0:57-743(+)